MEPNDEYKRRQAARRKAAARRRQQQLMLLCALLAIVLVALIGILIIFINRSPIVKQLDHEAGLALNAEAFLREEGKSAEFVTDISAIDLNIPGSHNVQLLVDGKVYDAVLNVQDTTAPTAEPVATTISGKVPEAILLLTNIKDASSDITASYQAPIDTTTGGEKTAFVLLSDAYGNSTVISVPVTVVLDETAPSISLAPYKEHWVYLGDSIAYKSYVTYFDDKTSTNKLVLTVNRDSVNTEKAGTYPVIYTVKDEAGNEASVTLQLTIKEKPTGYVEPDVAYGKAQQILAQITTEGMSKAEIAAAIYNYVRHSIGYDDYEDEDRGWAAAAMYGFNEHLGDCFVYYATAKALFDVAGIPNVDVVKVKTAQTSTSSHYWSLIDVGNGWYHVDCTPRAGVYDESFFLYTDEEMLAFSRANKNCFNFDLNAYPARQTASVQSHIQFRSLKVTIKESW